MDLHSSVIPGPFLSHVEWGVTVEYRLGGTLVLISTMWNSGENAGN